MRIIAGDWRGRRLASVGKGDAGAQLRPTTDRTRESLFNMLSGGRFGDPFDDADVLDLFAGTGALGLEALSRGARSAVFVDDGRVAGRLLRENIATLDCADRTRIITRDARRLPVTDTPCHLVFLDPPYGRNLGRAALEAATRGGWIAPRALVIWEESAPQETPEGFAALDARRYGDTYVAILEKQ